MNSNRTTLPVKKCTSECMLDVKGVCSTKEAVVVMKEYVGYGEDEDVKPEVVVEILKKKLNCGTEKCILKHPDFIKAVDDNSIIVESLDRFKPRGPANTTALLSNLDIDNLLTKLTNIHSDHYHMDFQMIDFMGTDRLPPTALGRLNIVEDVIKKGYKTFGVVMNTDIRTGGGIHWFALFCDFRKTPYTIEYFNSSGSKPYKEIQAWIIKTEREMATNLPQYKTTPVILKGMVHQKDSETECGLYSIYYIWNRLNNIPPEVFQARRIPDDDMIQFRTMCFTPR